MEERAALFTMLSTGFSTGHKGIHASFGKLGARLILVAKFRLRGAFSKAAAY